MANIIVPQPGLIDGMTLLIITCMKKTHILHNPNAGKGEYTKKELIAILESHGYKCGYSSTKEKGWKDFDRDVDFLVIAGGDGTVRKITVKLFDKENGRNPPIALLPLGTANNISKSLGISGHAKEIIAGIAGGKKQKFDVGRIKGSEYGTLFLESYGYGIFPALMKHMKDSPPTHANTPEEELKAALERVHNIILSQPAVQFDISIDGIEHQGKYIMVEVMNISSIGPNLGLSPNSDPGDAEFEVVLIPESQREEFASHVSHKINGIEKSFIPLIVKGSDISIATPPGLLHIDDELIETSDPEKVKIKPDHAMLEFLLQ
jgi:diacylglycerol kinase (ATP)